MQLRFSRAAYIGVLPALVNLACSGGTAADPDGSGTSSTAGASSMPGACEPNIASIQSNVFKAACDGAGCHGSDNPAAGLDLIDTPLDRLATTSSALCGGWSLVVPGSPEKSLLYQKLVSSMPACGVAMPVGKHLPEGSAQCIADWISGMGAGGGGCEKCGGAECVALSSDAEHCGTCDNACPSGVPCENGACSCGGGKLGCGGVCIDVTRDPKNCGACGNDCGAGSGCDAGKCTCPTGLATCGASCSDLQSDPANCGGCGKACRASEVCSVGKCATGCGSLTQCGASCVDTQTSLLHCGRCDEACAAGQSCSAGKCACSNGGQLCGGSCVDVTTDAANCGACGKACGAGEGCVNGACACNSGSGSVSFKNDVAPVLAGACTAAGCHSGMRPKENLALDLSKAYAELVNVTAEQCGGSKKLVVPGSPGTSYLMQKLLGVGVCTGTQMPKAGQSVPQPQLDAIGSWICAGAPNN
jgi:hypothetical protein